MGTVRALGVRQQLDWLQCGKKGKSGTYPTFIVDERWVIKFFGQQFEGQAAFKIEQEAARLVQRDGGIPVPKILQSGRLFAENENCEWPYLIFEYLPGTSIGDVWDRIPMEARLSLPRKPARWCGGCTTSHWMIQLYLRRIGAATWAS
jgi:Ser/Thr protein kinase RdoA (MazF antagonist)